MDVSFLRVSGGQDPWWSHLRSRGWGPSPALRASSSVPCSVPSGLEGRHGGEGGQKESYDLNNRNY